MIGVVIPTLPGREALYERTVAAYKETADVAIITVRNRPTIGQAWNDGAAVVVDAPEILYLHLSADDVLPQPGWAEAAVFAVHRNVYPSPRILNADGSLHSCGTMGGGMLLPECADWTVCGTSPFPFMEAAAWRKIGPTLPIGYYADDFLAWKARQAGYSPQVVRDFCLVHLEGTVGRQRSVNRSMQDRMAYLAAVGVESPAPAEVVA